MSFLRADKGAVRYACCPNYGFIEVTAVVATLVVM